MQQDLFDMLLLKLSGKEPLPFKKLTREVF
jgi:hypothetical protein